MKLYKYLVVEPEVEGQLYHEDTYNEEIFFVVPELLNEKLGDFRVFNGWSLEGIDEVLSHLVPIFNYIQAHQKRKSPKP